MSLVLEQISLIGGPGAHAENLLDILLECSSHVQYFHYYPKFVERYYVNGFLKDESHPSLFRFKDKFGAQIYNKLLGSTEKYNDFLWRMYDKEVSIRLKSSDALIAWPQVSLNSIKKQISINGKVILEYPMIHVLAWQEQMKRVYTELNIKQSKNIFSDSVVKRMLEEIALSGNINVISSYAKKTFIDYGVDDSKISVISPYVNDLDFCIDNQITKENQFTFLFVGRIDILKGAHLLLEAFHKANIADSQLLLVGHLNNEVKDYLQRYSKNVKHIPYQNKEQLRLLYNKSHVLVLPSVQESFGMVCLEAMLCGIPVIVSNQTVGYDVVSSENGLVFNSGALDELVDSFRKIHTNYISYSSVNIRKSVISKFNRTNYIKQYKSLLMSLL